jgi:hypothetical protein
VLGVFAGPIYFVEGKKLGEVISRNFALLGRRTRPDPRGGVGCRGIVVTR